MIRDVLKDPKVSAGSDQPTPMPMTTTTDSAGATSTTGLPMDQATSSSSSSVDEAFDSDAEVSEDFDVMLQAQELCIAWGGLIREVDITVEVGVGTAPDQDNAVGFTSVPNTGLACVNSTSLPAYTKLFSVVRANNSAGTVSFSSDGFTMVPAADTDNRLEVYSGKECTENDVIGQTVMGPSDSTIDLSLIVDVPIHRGDALFIELNPFAQNVTFSGATVLRTTLSGYQVVTTSPRITLTLPPATVTNTSATIMNCLKNEPLLLGRHHNSMAMSWEIAGRWEKLIKYFTVAVLDQTCVETSPQGEQLLYKHQQCRIAESRVGSTARTAKFDGVTLHNGHSYFTTVSACFDDVCFPSGTSDLVDYSADPKTVIYGKAKITAESLSSVSVAVRAQVAPSTDNNAAAAKSRRCVFMWTVARDRFGSIPLSDWRVGESTSCSAIEV